MCDKTFCIGVIGEVKGVREQFMKEFSILMKLLMKLFCLILLGQLLWILGVRDLIHIL